MYSQLGRVSLLLFLQPITPLQLLLLLLLWRWSAGSLPPMLWLIIVVFNGKIITFCIKPPRRCTFRNLNLYNLPSRSLNRCQLTTTFVWRADDLIAPKSSFFNTKPIILNAKFIILNAKSHQ